MQRKEILGLAALVMAAVIWGFAFVSQVQGMDSMSPLFFNAVRFTLGAISLLPVMALTRRRHRPTAGRARTAPLRRTYPWQAPPQRVPRPRG